MKKTKKTKTPRTSIKRQMKAEVKEIKALKEEKKGFRTNKKTLFISGFVLLVLLAAGIGKRGMGETERMKKTVIPNAVTKVLADPTIQVKDVSNLKKISGVFEFELTLDYGEGSVKTFTSYITKDGKILFTSGIKVEDLVLGAQTEQQEASVSCEDVKKSDTPSVTAFVVSQCPYGLQMQRVVSAMLSEEGALAGNVAVKYIGSVENGKVTSMHGEKEAEENLRQICIREEQRSLYWKYVSCYMQEGKSEECMKSVGVDTAKLSSCQSDVSRGLSYAQKDFDEAEKFGISSSPSLLVNGQQVVSEFNFGGRTPDAIKNVVCCASNNTPGFCSQELSKETVATSFSTKVAGAATDNAAANCGN